MKVVEDPYTLRDILVFEPCELCGASPDSDHSDSLKSSMTEPIVSETSIAIWRRKHLNKNYTKREDTNNRPLSIEKEATVC